MAWVITCVVFTGLINDYKFFCIQLIYLCKCGAQSRVYQLDNVNFSFSSFNSLNFEQLVHKNYAEINLAYHGLSFGFVLALFFFSFEVI